MQDNNKDLINEPKIHAFLLLSFVKAKFTTIINENRNPH